MKIHYDVETPMRDGVRLSADLYLPSEAGRYPVILQRTPYNNNSSYVVEEAHFYVEQGYAYVAQDCRGKFDSDGCWYPYRHEAQDGDDTISWCAAQPWSTGRIGMTGASYCGAVQWYAATTGNPYLKCIAPAVTFSDPFFDHGLRRDGIFQTYYVHWATSMAGRTFFSIDDRTSNSAPWIVPLLTLDQHLGFDIEYWRDFLLHDSYDDFWRALSIRDKYGLIDVPALNIGGWHSPWELQGTLSNYIGMRNSAKSAEVRDRQELVVGPWTHAINSSRRVGDQDFGPDALIDLRGRLLRWFDRWLKEEETAIEDQPPVAVFVMGDNVWRYEATWPLPQAVFTRYYIHSGGNANSLIGDGALTMDRPDGEEPPDRFTYNPERPVISQLGDRTYEEELFLDRRPIERRDDVLVYSTDPLEEDIEVTGPISVKVWATTSAPDTDFIATLLDVDTDGYSRPLTWGAARGRYLNGPSNPALLAAGELYEWNIDMWATSNAFKKGHRIRLDISSSFFPFFGRNHNTGGPPATDVEFRLAHQVLFHSTAHPSYLLLPIVPRGGKAEERLEDHG